MLHTIVILLFSCSAVVAETAPTTDARFYRYKLNSFIGTQVTDQTAPMTGLQFGLAPVKRMPFYAGPEINFSNFSGGSLLEVLASGWYEVRIYGAPRLSLSFGALIGVGIASGLPRYSSVCAVTYGEIAISQEVSDVANIKGSFRPGFVGGYYAFIISLGVSFHFV